MAGLALVVSMSFPLAEDGDRIVMLDVGQGDALLVTSRGSSLLIDTGNQDAKLLRGLARNRVSHLGSVLVTHSDDDHCGSLDQVGKSVSVDRAILAKDMLSCESPSARQLVEQVSRIADEIVGVEVGDTFDVGAFTVRVLWPATFTEEGGNADSLCVLLEYDGDDDGLTDHTALMTGDAEKDQLEDMIGMQLVGDVDVLKVGHHGSRNGMTQDEVLALRPEIALISCGLHNRYGHPAQDTLDLLEGAGTAAFRTDLDGEVTCAFTPESINVTCERR